jgi:hypothetical protein
MMDRGDNRVGQVGSGSDSDRSGRIRLTKKNIGSQIGFESDFRSNTIRFFESQVISGHVRSNFEFL